MEIARAVERADREARALSRWPAALPRPAYLPRAQQRVCGHNAHRLVRNVEEPGERPQVAVPIDLADRRDMLLRRTLPDLVEVRGELAARALREDARVEIELRAQRLLSEERRDLVVDVDRIAGRHHRCDRRYVVQRAAVGRPPL